MRQKASTPAALKMAAAAMVLRNMLKVERVACETTIRPVRGVANLGDAGVKD